MLHELLLALVGCTGDVFMDVKQQASALGLNTPKKRGESHGEEGDEKEEEEEEEEEEDEAAAEVIGDECTFRLAPDLSFLQHSERWLHAALSLAVCTYPSSTQIVFDMQTAVVNPVE